MKVPPIFVMMTFSEMANGHRLAKSRDVFFLHGVGEPIDLR